ncbi:hypothetical protein [Yersinia enterocolitica]|uniref:Phage protein n=1 Tax=Yersinia enterocolitica TaxID=630 RepID=A0ABM9S229_YEREN|nr:hypothetical protein [Yersinia enterocolitica]CND98099.1 Uncharacterised protein [Yersinia enterocolitica]CRX85150.1 Uncharacterised protein [Yersinia enterocolitica]
MPNKLKDRLSYLKDARAYKRWLKKNHFMEYLNDETYREVVSITLIKDGPEQYPCYVISMCVSCNYQESEPFFIYSDDLTDMAATIQRATAAEGNADAE